MDAPSTVSEYLQHEMAARQQLDQFKGRAGFLGFAKGRGAKLRLRFDSGADGAVPLSLIRERWHVPLRVLLLWGDYHQATVMEMKKKVNHAHRPRQYLIL